MGHSDHRPRSAEKTLRRCRNSEKDDNVILIDVDSDSLDNVINIDLPEPCPERKVEKLSYTNIIYIDDDETSDSNCSDDANNVRFAANTSSNREPSHATTIISNSIDAAVEGCQHAQDNTTPVRLSKCKRTYSGKISGANRYGLDLDSDSDSSDSELVEDSSGKVQELWEKAFFRRRKDTCNGPPGIRDHGSTSENLGTNQHQKPRIEDVIRLQKDATIFLSKEKFNSKTDAPCTFRNGDPSFGSKRVFDDPTDLDLSQSAPETDLHNHVQSRSSSQSKGSSAVHTEQVDLSDCVLSDNDSEEREEYLPSSNFAFGDDHQAPAFMDEEACPPISGSCADEGLCSGNSSPIDEDQNFQMDADRVQENEHFATGSANEMDHFMPERCSVKRSTLPNSETNPSPSSPTHNAVKLFPGRQSHFSEHFSVSEVAIEQDHHQANKQPAPEITLCVNHDLSQAKLQEDESFSSSDHDNEDGGLVHTENADTLPPVETSIITEREMIKETDEYKRAIEAEWASRQQALASQAEEAQRMRRLIKRRKAESMRMLDMERRQKQRLEEIRNTQKMDEENRTLKEAIRAEVRKELKQLETTCLNVASLLHFLGVNVNGWPNPSPQQVQAAYKKALLTFHPDRALQSDMRLQVEAEEKFKLINRMKEKLSPSNMTHKK